MVDRRAVAEGGSRTDPSGDVEEVDWRELCSAAPDFTRLARPRIRGAATDERQSCLQAKQFASAAPHRQRPPREPSRIGVTTTGGIERSEEHTSELQSRQYLVCRLLLEKKKKNKRK